MPPPSKVLLGAIVAGMMSIDMGGPFNKAAYVFGTAALASGNYEVMAAVMVGGIFVFPVVDHAVMYVAALAIGSAVGAVILSLLKKNRTEDGSRRDHCIIKTLRSTPQHGAASQGFCCFWDPGTGSAVHRVFDDVAAALPGKVLDGEHPAFGRGDLAV